MEFRLQSSNFLSEAPWLRGRVGKFLPSHAANSLRIEGAGPGKARFKVLLTIEGQRLILFISLSWPGRDYFTVRRYSRMASNCSAPLPSKGSVSWVIPSGSAYFGILVSGSIRVGAITQRAK